MKKQIIMMVAAAFLLLAPLTSCFDKIDIDEGNSYMTDNIAVMINHKTVDYVVIYDDNYSNATYNWQVRNYIFVENKTLVNSDSNVFYDLKKVKSYEVVARALHIYFIN